MSREAGITARLTLGLAAAALASAGAPRPVQAGGTGAPSFNRDVRPILAANCFPCHGPDRNQREAGLRLDVEEAAKAPTLLGSVAIVPGSPDQSELMLRVRHASERRRMPSARSGKPRLSAAQIETLRRWIESGAEWEPHWAYVPPTRPEPPATRDDAWPRSPIDRFVLAALEERQLAPSHEADRAQLLRRLSLDLTGLVPTPEEVHAFSADTRADAYERQVDRLLASPRYGERMAAFWLDLVRYSDSVGYHSDNARPMWRYRDWVVAAFNRNLPFDRFTAEQLAGDLLPGAGHLQRIASGYNRLLQTTEEGGAQAAEYRAIYLADRVRNVSSVWMGATLGCAQCHDHKFDPYLARDFYAFEAFFADIQETPVGRRQPDYLMGTAKQRQLEGLEAAIDRRREELRAAAEARPAAEWERALATRRRVPFTTLEPVRASSANGTRVLIQGNDFSVIASTSHGPKPPRDSYTVSYRTELTGLRAVRLEAVTFDELPGGGPGRDPEGGFVISELELRDGSGRPVPLAHATASTRDGGGFSAGAAVDGRGDEGGWALTAADGESHRLVLELADPDAVAQQTRFTLVLHQNAGDLRTLGRFRLSGTADAPPVGTGPGPEPSRELLEIAALDPDARSQEQAEELAGFRLRHDPGLAGERAALRVAEIARQSFLAGLPASYVTEAREPDPVRVLPRGNWQDESGAVVAPAVPGFLGRLDTGGARATRLDLARWLTSARNPLTARVLANRLWRLCFGRGLAGTVEDLGAQGEWPSHPELLDWLAVELVEGGWDLKHLLRQIVTSAAYRQASKGTPEVLAEDPDNRLLARQSRFRLDAEMVRDNALAISGLLSPRLGGPSVHPYQPPGYWAHLNFPPREWDDSPGEDQYRRALYTWWQRSFPHPSLIAFDAPSREECVAERPRSNVPQQALALLNDPTYVEAARAFAERILREGGRDAGPRLRWAWARALQRPPENDEIAILEELLQRARAQFEADPEAARRLVAIGQAPLPEDLSGAELAAWTQVARAILNLPELVTRS
jgi:hypothetical protein